MKHLIIITLSLFTLHLSLHAAVPVRWTVETSRVQPAVFEAYQGETLDLAASLQSYGNPVEIPGPASLFWQTNGMGARWWTAPASVSSNVLSAVWHPTNDVGARVYNCFIGQSGSNYRAEFQLRLRPSPGASPNQLPLPTVTYDAHLNGTPTVNGTNLVDIISSNIGHEVAAFSSTGTVARASSVGTADTWTDETGCVWRVETIPARLLVFRTDNGDYQSRRLIETYPADNDTMSSFGGGVWQYTGDTYECEHPSYASPGMDDLPPYTEPPPSFAHYHTYINPDDPSESVYIEAEIAPEGIVTNFIGRVALTNDVMPRAEAEARFDAVDRPYSMIYDPVAGRALTADGRLVDYGRAPRISGRLAVAVDADSSYSSAGWPSGYLPSLALISGTNLVEGVDYTLVITPSGQTSDGAYTNATAQVQWRIVGTGYYSMSVLPVTATVTKTVSGESTTTSLALWSNYGYGSVCSIEVPDIGEGELGITDVVIDGHDVSVAWYFYSSGGYYSGVDVFSMEYDDNGGDGVHPTAYGDRGRFATVSDMQGYVTDAIDSRVGQMDSVRSLEIMRKDGMLEYGTGPGILKWDFVTDDRRWILNVPNLSASMNVFQNNNNWTDLTTWPMNLSTPPRSDLLERRFVRSWGDAGNGRCLASQWHVEAAFIDCIMQADVVVSNGVVQVLSSSASPYPQGMLFGCDPSYPNAKINMYSYFGDVGSGTAKARCYFAYTVNSGPSGAQPARPCISMSTAPGSYASVTCGYVRAISPVNKNYMWDAGLRRTWQVSVSNGSFFAEIVSTNNLLYTETHQ